MLKEIKQHDAKKFVHTCELKRIDTHKTLELKIVTTKGKGYIWTTASVSIIEDTGKGYSTETHAIYGDYWKNVLRVPSKRIMQQHIKAQHFDVIQKHGNELVNDAKAFYKIA